MLQTVLIEMHIQQIDLTGNSSMSVYLLMSDYYELKGEDSWPDEWYYDELFQPGDMVIKKQQPFIVLERETNYIKMLSNQQTIVYHRKQGIFGPLYAEL